MNRRIRRAFHLALYGTLAISLGASGDDDDDKAPPPGTAPTLNAEQQRATGLQLSHPVAAKAPERTEAIGTVLDPTALLADESEVAVASAQEHAASSEAVRLHGLYQGGASASLKMVEAAQAEEAKARADSRLAEARFAQHWGPLASLPPDPRRKLTDAVGSGHAALVRADLPGRHVIGSLPAKAVLDIDGMQVPGRVLGALEQPSELQSAGLLIEVSNPPRGLAPGARISLLYGESGAYVYKRIAPKTPKDSVQYVQVKVTPLAPYGDGWLVKGVDDDDDIVVRGVGVLWSLEGMGAHPADDDDD
jgi:hypothetical protein